eukprot:4194085-Pleurochrysis_carterae.AAC.1
MLAYSNGTVVSWQVRCRFGADARIGSLSTRQPAAPDSTGRMRLPAVKVALLAASVHGLGLSPHATRLPQMHRMHPLSVVAHIDQHFMSSYCRVARRQPTPRCSAAASTDALASARDALMNANADSLVAVHLETNSWLLSFYGVRILLDPVLEGPLDFGLPPQLYSASRKVLPNFGLVPNLPPVDLLLLSQGLADHAHPGTLAALAAAGLKAPIVAPPSAKAALERHFAPSQITYLSSGQTKLVSAAGSSVSLRATSGALVGPPWQARENGYVLSSPSAGKSLYYEPHCEFDADELKALSPVDVMITPITGEGLPGFELVHG